MLRSWQACFLLTGIVFLLQLFPYTGVFLMMLAAPFWSVLLINLGFVLMARDSWRRTQSKWLLVFPVIWFGGYFCVAAASHWQAYRFNVAIASANEDKLISFDPAKRDILIEPDRKDSSNGSALTPDTMIESFGLSRAYQVTDASQNKIQGYSLNGMPCPGQMGAGVSGNTVWQKLHDGGYGTGSRMTFAQNLCLFISTTRPDKPIIRIRPQPQTESAGLANYVSQNVAITTPDNRTVVLRSGWAIPLSWFPQPVMGCWLNSGAPAWQCDAAFIREKLYDPKRDLTPNGADDVVGRALGLTKASIRARYSGVGWR